MFLGVLVFASMLMFSGCEFFNTIWGSIKDRYKPFEFVGQDGDKVLVKFVFDSPSANSIWLAGAFNNWANGESLPRYPQVELSQGAVIDMKIDPGTGYWTTVIPLAPGRYQYKYVLDSGRVWSADPNTEHVDDGFGGHNSIIVVIAQ